MVDIGWARVGRAMVEVVSPGRELRVERAAGFRRGKRSG